MSALLVRHCLGRTCDAAAPITLPPTASRRAELCKQQRVVSPKKERIGIQMPNCCSAQLPAQHLKTSEIFSQAARADGNIPSDEGEKGTSNKRFWFLPPAFRHINHPVEFITFLLFLPRVDCYQNKKFNHSEIDLSLLLSRKTSSHSVCSEKLKSVCRRQNGAIEF